MSKPTFTDPEMGGEIESTWLARIAGHSGWISFFIFSLSIWVLMFKNNVGNLSQAVGVILLSILFVFFR